MYCDCAKKVVVRETFTYCILHLREVWFALDYNSLPDSKSFYIYHTLSIWIGDVCTLESTRIRYSVTMH